MNDIISPENLVYKKPTLMNDTPMHYCPGCSHGVVHKLVAEVNAGQMVQDVRLAVNGQTPVEHFGRLGGIVPEPEEIVEALKKLIK